jgi:hypothetical protein
MASLYASMCRCTNEMVKQQKKNQKIDLHQKSSTSFKKNRKRLKQKKHVFPTNEKCFG